MAPELLRQLVREVVREVLAEVLSEGLNAAPPHMKAVPPHADQTRPSPVSRNNHAAADIRRIQRGAVSERVVRDAARDGVRLVLGPKAVLTPLGRDLSRTLGVDVEHLTNDREH
jgi:uncharacterized protein (UPF0297 family)